MDFEMSLRRAIKSGTVQMGQKTTKEAVEEDKAQMVVVAENCPDEFKNYLNENENLFVFTYEGSSVQLGKTCGKPFMVSALAVLEPGESDILSLKRG